MPDELPAHYHLLHFMKTNRVTATVLADTLGLKVPAISRWCNGHVLPNERNRLMIWILSGLSPDIWDKEEEEKDWSEDLEKLKPLIEDLLPTAQRHANERIKELSEGVS